MIPSTLYCQLVSKTGSSCKRQTQHRFPLPARHTISQIAPHRAFRHSNSDGCRALRRKREKEHDKSAVHLLFIWFDFLRPIQQSFSYIGTDLPWLNQYEARINVSFSRTQCSDACEARTSGPSVLSQALYHWATVLRPYQSLYNTPCYNMDLDVGQVVVTMFLQRNYR